MKNNLHHTVIHHANIVPIEEQGVLPHPTKALPDQCHRDFHSLLQLWMTEGMDGTESNADSRRTQPLQSDAQRSHVLTGFMPSGKKMLDSFGNFRGVRMLATRSLYHSAHDIFLLKFLQQNADMEYEVDTVTKMRAQSHQRSL